MKRIYKILILTAVVAIGAVSCYILMRKPAPEPALPYRIEPARVKAIEEMVRLSALEIREDVPIKATVNGKGIFATSTMVARIYYDFDSLELAAVSPDSVYVILPAEKIELLESSEPGSYRVLDTWDERNTFFPRRMTAREENAVKRKFSERFLASIRHRHLVEQARHNAVETLRQLGIYVVDTIPARSYRPLDI